MNDDTPEILRRMDAARAAAAGAIAATRLERHEQALALAECAVADTESVLRMARNLRQVASERASQ